MRSVILVLRQSIKAIDGYPYLTLYYQASRVVMWRVACPPFPHSSEAIFSRVAPTRAKRLRFQLALVESAGVSPAIKLTIMLGNILSL